MLFANIMSLQYVCMYHCPFNLFRIGYLTLSRCNKTPIYSICQGHSLLLAITTNCFGFVLNPASEKPQFKSLDHNV